MAKRIAITTLNASTLDILNTIRANASYEYQELVPEVEVDTDIPKVGEVLYGYPAMANQFINALVNRIALVRVKSATFNNAYAELKKGYLEFGETVEEVFVGICKAREFSAEKAEARELKRSLPDVRSAFHTMNWRVQYPITIQDEDLRMAFTSINGVQDLIAKIVDAVYTASEYDEYLLFKYLMIKAITSGKMYPVGIDMSNDNNMAIKFRGMSNQLTFMGKKYNASGVTTTTPKADQYIFMDSQLNAQYDVNVLASAFNMDKAEFAGKLKLIDDWTTFDNDRFNEITANSDMIEAITDDELALMANVKAVLIDKEWFQVYDNANKMTEKYVASGMYWNYFYNVWKTVSSSPFSNAIVFVDDEADITTPETLTVNVTNKSVGDNATILTLEVEEDTTLGDTRATFVQSEVATQAGIAVHKYGAIIYPSGSSAINLVIKIGDDEYVSNSTIGPSANVGDSFTFTKSGTTTLPTLTGLGITATNGNYTIDKDFDVDTTSYEVEILTPEFTLVPTTGSGNTVSITLDGEEYDATQTTTLEVGEHTFVITVSDGTLTNTYTVVVTRLATLTSLGVTVVNGNYNIDNAFDNEDTVYGVEVISPQLTLVPVASSGNSVSITLDGEEYDATQTTTLETGSHVFVITVTNGSLNSTYTVNVTRLTDGVIASATVGSTSVTFNDAQGYGEVETENASDVVTITVPTGSTVEMFMGETRYISGDTLTWTGSDEEDEVDIVVTDTDTQLYRNMALIVTSSYTQG